MNKRNIPGCIDRGTDVSGWRDGEEIFNKCHGRWYEVSSLEELVGDWLEALKVIWLTYGDTNSSGREAHDVLEAWGKLKP